LKNEQISKAVGFEVGEFEYVWAETVYDDETTRKIGKTHIIAIAAKGTQERYRTLCGIEDVCGNWPFSAVENPDDPDFCKRCKAVLERIAKENG